MADWVQQGRLLEEDQLRPSGTSDWQLLGSIPAFAAYLPKTEPFRTEDQAEALEPVQLDFAYRPRPIDEDDDVDMIPLIDVSLVLLIFFMMTTTVAGAASLIKTPVADQGTQLTSDSRYWIGIDRTEGGGIVYSLGKDDGGPAVEDRQLTEDQVIKKLEARLRSGRPVNVHIRGGQKVPYKYIKRITVALKDFHDRNLVRLVFTEVTSKENS